MTPPLAGRTALVTGSVQGIGEAIALRLAAAGARIVVHGLGGRELGEAACSAMRAAGAPEARFSGADLRQPDEIGALFAELDSRGGVDILVNNAGVQQTALLPDVTAELWDTILAVNLSAAFHTMRCALPAMAERGYGRVINIASVHGLVASVAKGPYVAAKFGLVGLSRVAALEYARAGDATSGGVTVNCICPGWTDTPLIAPQVGARAAQANLTEHDALESLLAEKQPTRRLSSPDEIGAFATWLCSPLAHNVTGVAFPIDGGWTAQ